MVPHRKVLESALNKRWILILCMVVLSVLSACREDRLKEDSRVIVIFPMTRLYSTATGALNLTGESIEYQPETFEVSTASWEQPYNGIIKIRIGEVDYYYRTFPVPAGSLPPNLVLEDSKTLLTESTQEDQIITTGTPYFTIIGGVLVPLLLTLGIYGLLAYIETPHERSKTVLTLTASDHAVPIDFTIQFEIKSSVNALVLFFRIGLGRIGSIIDNHLSNMLQIVVGRMHLRDLKTERLLELVSIDQLNVELDKFGIKAKKLMFSPRPDPADLGSLQALNEAEEERKAIEEYRRSGISEAGLSAIVVAKMLGSGNAKQAFGVALSYLINFIEGAVGFFQAVTRWVSINPSVPTQEALPPSQEENSQ